MFGEKLKDLAIYRRALEGGFQKPLCLTLKKRTILKAKMIHIPPKTLIRIQQIEKIRKSAKNHLTFCDKLTVPVKTS